MLFIISASLASNTPCTWPSFITEIISSSVTFSSGSFGSIPDILRIISAIFETQNVTGIKTTVIIYVILVSFNDIPLECLDPNFLGIIIPNTNKIITHNTAIPILKSTLSILKPIHIPVINVINTDTSCTVLINLAGSFIILSTF